MMMRVVVMVVLLLLSSCVVRAQAPPCTDADASRAFDESDSFRNWDALHQSYKRYRQCDDGAAAEGYSESVARILADHWETLSRFAELSRQDSGFRRFVLNHIDATLNTDDLHKIESSAATRCTVNLRKVCADVRAAASAAIEESSR